MPGKVIAIVDDEPHMVDLLSTYLKLRGYEVRGVYTGEDALTMVQVENPDALLLDLMLPDIDGFEVCRRLRATPAFARLPIIVVSARTDQDAVNLATRAGANAYLTKPVKFPDLISELTRLLG
jgi:DNA-binding response OmpR family regulator